MKIENKSGLHPLGRAVLVIPHEPEIKKSAIALPQQVQERLQTLEARAIVLEIGPLAWEDESVPRAAVGDVVLTSKLAGYMAKGPKDGKTYRLVNANDIFCRLEEDYSG